MIPVFKRRKGDGSLLISDSGEALAMRRERRGKGYYVPPKSPTVVRADAVGRVQHLGGDVGNSKHLLGQFQIQFGQFRNETFLWLAENALGYIAYLVASTENESAHSDSKNNWVNKMALVKYLRLFPEGNEAISVKAGKKVPKIVVPASRQPPMHYQTARYRRIKAEEEAEGKTRRTYTKTKHDRQCKKCGEVIVKETHKNLWGAIYCPTTSNETFEEFRQRRYAEVKKDGSLPTP